MKRREQIYNDAEAKIGLIKTGQEELFDLEAIKFQCAEKMEGREAEIYIQVCAELDDNQKPKFSNDGARKAELTKRLKESRSYQNFKTEFEVSAKNVALKRISIDALSSYVNLARAYLHGGD